MRKHPYALKVAAVPSLNATQKLRSVSLISFAFHFFLFLKIRARGAGEHSSSSSSRSVSEQIPTARSSELSTRVNEDTVVVDVVQTGGVDDNNGTGTNINLRHFALSDLSFRNIHVHLDLMYQVAHPFCDLTRDHFVAMMQSFSQLWDPLHQGSDIDHSV